MMLIGENRSSWIETYPRATSSTTYSVSTSPVSNASRRDAHVNDTLNTNSYLNVNTLCGLCCRKHKTWLDKADT